MLLQESKSWMKKTTNYFKKNIRYECFSMERIFKRSERNKNLFFGADTYCYPLMFYMVSDTRLPDCRFVILKK